MYECDQRMTFRIYTESQINLTMCLVVFNEILGHFTRNTVDVGDFIAESYAIEFISMLQQFGSESSRNKLCIVAELMNHIGHRFSVLSIQSLRKKK